MLWNRQIVKLETDETEITYSRIQWEHECTTFKRNGKETPLILTGYSQMSIYDQQKNRSRCSIKVSLHLLFYMYKNYIKYSTWLALQGT